MTNAIASDFPAWEDRDRFKQYASYLAGLRQKLALVSKPRVGSAAKASRSYFTAEIERVQAILDADRSELRRARLAWEAAEAAVRAQGEQSIPADEEGEVAYYVRRNRLLRASAQAQADHESAVQKHRLPPLSWSAVGSAEALRATAWVAELIRSARTMNSSTHAGEVIRRAVSGVCREEAMQYGYWEEKGSLDAEVTFDAETRRMFEYRWYWVAKELGLETGPEPDSLVALGYGHPWS